MDKNNRKRKIAEFIAIYPMCLMAGIDESNRSMLFKDISEEDFISIVEILKDDSENGSKILSEQSDSVRTLIKVEGRWSDKVTLTYTKSTKNVRVQGRPLLLYNEITSFLNELVDIDKVVEMLEDNFQQNVSKDSVEEQFRYYLPNSYDKHTDKLKKSLLKAVYNLNVTSQEYTCTELAFEVLRALEGHVKITLLKDYNVKSLSKHGTLTMFKFDEATDTITFKDPDRSIIGNISKIEYFERAYKSIVIYRHKIFHWDYPNEFGIDETIQFENLDNVKQIIVDILRLIDEYYIV